MNVNELPCPCSYWKCVYWNRDTDECGINHQDCFINRMEQTENEEERIDLERLERDIKYIRGKRNEVA